MKKQFKRLRVRTVSAVAALVFAANTWAVEPFTVRDIRVEGLQRVEPGTVFASLPFRVGDQYNDEKGSAAIRALFALGLFKDVRLETQGDVLIVVVEERPTVADVDFVGTREFDKDTLKKALRDIGLTEGRPYDQALADRAEQELKRQYINRSLYAADVVTTVTPIERNRVNLTFTVTEGDPTKIRELHIVGNKSFSESTLRGQMELNTGSWLSWYTKSDRYSRTKLNADLEALRSYYLQRGFLEFRIDSTQVAISPDKQDISITINITEGERYVVSGVRLEGDFLGREEEFKSLVKIKPGEPYNADQVAETTKAFTDYFGNFGYAFAQVEARPEIDHANNRVSFVLAAEPSRRAYVRRINISGNNRTRDEVIRREFRQFESSWYDAEKIKLSRDRVDRLGFFKDVNVETSDVPGAPDQVDLNIAVTERPTGSLQIGAGFSSAEKLGLSFAIKQENAFGTGNYLAVEVNTSKYNKTIAFNSTDPYFTPDGISRTFDIYYRASKPYEQQGGDYRLNTAGTSLRFGVPFSEVDTVFFGAGLERTEIVAGTNIPAAYLAYAEQFGTTSNTLPLTLGWSRDDRDSSLAPTTGRYQRLGAEWGVAGDARYIRGNYQYQQFLPLSKAYTFAFNGEVGYGTGLNGQPYPVFKNFYSGGLGSVRGFQQGTLGPRDITGSSIGGPKKVTFNFELATPFPGAGNDRTLRLFGFVDTGNVFAEDQKVSFADFRASAGLGVSWLSPVGPLRIAFAQPIRTKPGDRIQKIQFQIGTSF
ncbi:outer membrane protein assembly factor BamA [Ramlibacter ginsenosidimutans]|uniref:Outer membrane protein assembly factor BamA n=1 Tax=Ramlibacter ginsenosidimutans TaxID=502333 RepID=A0A934TSG3_9BURK|nr:outer membrane protein assembly factor BamA [Ramlibacter ginsenosidimutans]MBK6006480.1 outer membrane protein assembly factor BamA [Ramlibacter ginsenosidimutans]